MQLVSPTALRAALLAVGVLAAACSKTTAATDGQPDVVVPPGSGSTLPAHTVSGRASAGPVADATVEVFLVDDTGANVQALGSTQSDASGVFSLTVNADPNALLAVEVQSGTYHEESTGTQVTIGAPLRAMVTAQAAANIGVTPLTEIVVQRALATANDANSFADAVLNARYAVSLATGLADISIAPADPNAPVADPNSQGAKYALVLAGLSQLAANSNINSLQLGAALALNFSTNGSLDPGAQAASIVIHRADGTTTTLSPTAWSVALPAAVHTYLSARGADVGLSVQSLTTLVANPPLVHPDIAAQGPTPTSLSLADDNQGSIAAGTSEHVTATAVFAEGPSRNFSQQVQWVSSNPNIATVTPAGVVAGVAPGTVHLTASIGTLSQSLSLTVTAATLASLSLTEAHAVSLAVGALRQLTATGTFTDGSHQDLTAQASFTTSNATNLTVGSHGLLTGQHSGSATITATANGVTATLPVTVTSASLHGMALAPATATTPPNIAAGTSLQLAALGSFDDSTTQAVSGTVTYASNATTIATVSAGGLVHGVSPGTATITASYMSYTGTLQVTVAAATLQGIALAAPQLLSPNLAANGSTTLAVGSSTLIVTNGTYSDGIPRPLARQAVTYLSSNANNIVVDANGLATAQAAGASTITVASGNVTATLALTATSATLSSIAIEAAPQPPALAPGTVIPVLPNGVAIPLMAVGTFSDGTHQDVTWQATWASSAASSLSVTHGLLTALQASGSANITATFLSQTGTRAVTSNTAALSSVAVTGQGPASGNRPLQFTEQFRAVGTFDDATTFDLTPTAAWSLSDSAKGAVTHGLVVSAGVAGTTDVVATQGGITGTFTLTLAQ